MTFWAKWNRGPLWVWLATLVGVLVVIAAVSALARAAVGPGALALLILVLVLASLVGVLLLYATCFSLLRYQLDRNGLIISAGLFRLYIPVAAIAGVYAAPDELPSVGFRGLRLSGHNIGFVPTELGKRIIYLATAAPEDCLYVMAAERIYAISPAEPEQFLRRFAIDRTLGPVEHWRESVRVAYVMQTLVWRDSLGVGLAVAALMGGLVLLAVAFLSYPGLPAEIPMHFDPLGRPDLMAPPQHIFYLPLIGGIVTVANFALAIGLYSRERLLSYYLWGGAALVQVLLIFALRAITA